MIRNIYTQHAQVRMQQRSVPPIIEKWLDEYGEEQYASKGALYKYFSKKSIKKMQADLGDGFIGQISKYLNAYKVESSTDGTVITVGWRYKKVLKS